MNWNLRTVPVGVDGNQPYPSGRQARHQKQSQGRILLVDGNQPTVFFCLGRDLSRQPCNTMTDHNAPPARPPWKKLHDDACSRGEHIYIDPETGYVVFTELALKDRGYCCESGCRHCPWGFRKPTQ